MISNVDSNLLNSIRLCHDRSIPASRREEAVQNALRENPRNSGFTGRMLPLDSTSAQSNGVNGNGDRSMDFAAGPGRNPLSLALTVGSLWANGKTLRVRFLGGSTLLQNRVKKYINEWTEYANIYFEFVTAEPSDIRVDFKIGCGSWSFIGTDALLYPNEATVNFGWLTDNSEEQEVSRVVLHEFGHVMGCIHEHQSPNVTIPWNLPVVYDYFKRMSGWDEATTYHNILDMYPAKETIATAFDPESIMLYFFDKQLITGGASMRNNTVLSKNDKEFIATIYPRTAPKVGFVNTQQIVPMGTKNPTKMSIGSDFQHPLDATPEVAIGMSWIDAEAGNSLKLAAVPTQITRSGLTIDITSADTNISSAGYQYIRLPPTSSTDNIQTGEIVYNGSSSFSSEDIPITFPKQSSFKAPPNVIAWFSGIDITRTSGFTFLGVSTERITTAGFVLRLSSSQPDSSSYKINWLAASSDAKSIVQCGRFSGKPSSGQSISHYEFQQGFKAPPHVMMAISSLGFVGNDSLRVRVSESMISQSGMNWAVESWGDSQIINVDVSYIALA